MAFEAFRQRIGSIIDGFAAAQAHRRLRGFRASRAHVNTLIAASGDTIAKGYVRGSDIELVIGALLTIGSVVWSVADKRGR